MMVVHEDNERPVELAVIRKPLLEQKSYIIVKNHVRELTNTAQNMPNNKTNEDRTSQNSSLADTRRKKRKSEKKHEESPVISSEPDIVSSSSTYIESDDLEELKSVYMKCKKVMKKIETKYGHLLDLDSEESSNSKSKKRKTYTETSEDDCNCKPMKKIIFDDDGRQQTVESITDKHICTKNIKQPTIHKQNISAIAVEYEDDDDNDDIVLPDDLNVLQKMSQDHSLEKTYRNKVADKIRSIKQEYVNEIKFNRHILIEKLKSNPDDLLDFKGTNLSSIPGYS